MNIFIGDPKPSHIAVSHIPPTGGKLRITLYIMELKQRAYQLRA